MGLSIVITIAVFMVITVLLLTLNLHYNKQYHQCDTDLLFWCYSDWRCQFGTYDGAGNPVGSDNDPNTIPMNCYIRGMYGKITDPADECYKYAGTYNRPPDKCQPTSTTTPTCSGDDGDIYPCSCNTIAGGEYATNYFNQIGFFAPEGSNVNTNDVQSCSDAGVDGKDPSCWTVAKIICSQIGRQLGSCTA